MNAVTRAPEERDSLTITFVSPLVLRKELENMLENDGDITLQSPEVVEKKSVIFWNMVSVSELCHFFFQNNINPQENKTITYLLRLSLSSEHVLGTHMKSSSCSWHTENMTCLLLDHYTLSIDSTNVLVANMKPLY